MEKLLLVYPKKGKGLSLTCEKFQRKDDGFEVSCSVEGFIYFDNVAAVIDAEKNRKSDATRPNLFHVYLKGLESEKPRVVKI